MSPALAARFERCSVAIPGGHCRRVLGHDGPCRLQWHAYEVCSAWMPYARERCARRAGHRWEHRSPYALENARASAIGGWTA